MLKKEKFPILARLKLTSATFPQTNDLFLHSISAEKQNSTSVTWNWMDMIKKATLSIRKSWNNGQLVASGSTS